jgi:hypothetical protein
MNRPRSLPVFTQTCDIYRNGNTPPSSPDVAGVACHLTAGYARGIESTDPTSVSGAMWTHILLVAATVDVRDGYEGELAWDGMGWDHVWVPNQNGTRFRVVFVERVDRDTPADHKRVYLDRRQPAWPTNDL